MRRLSMKWALGVLMVVALFFALEASLAFAQEKIKISFKETNSTVKREASRALVNRCVKRVRRRPPFSLVSLAVHQGTSPQDTLLGAVPVRSVVETSSRR